LRDTRLARPASPGEEFVHQRQEQFLTASAAAVGIETAADIRNLVKSGNPQQRRACDGRAVPGLDLSAVWPVRSLAFLRFGRDRFSSAMRPTARRVSAVCPPAVRLGAVAVAATGVRQANHSQGI